MNVVENGAPIVHVIAMGPFGAAVAATLPSAWRLFESHDPADAARPELWPRVDVQIVISQREHRRLFDSIDEAAAALGRPWIPVVVESRSFRVGPTIVPGGGACYRCFVRRQHQHKRRTATDRQLSDVTADLNNCLYRGFLPAHVAATARLIRELVADVLSSKDGPTPRRPRMFRLGFAEMTVHESAVVAVNGCNRCEDPPEADAGWRSLQHLSVKLLST